ncbi:hypothetical protein [Sphingomonas bacterium]|uniref:hypothetical protein n=1 Tax=Sphingomonas bacterium TaxID=1895847 RepID=UPI001576016E|nr:hypothetical protein [Sphingomonas bacterium]
MAAPKHKIEWSAPEEAPSAGARGTVVAGQMPARALQNLLSEHAGVLAEPHADRWSQRRALTFIVASATALWAALIVIAHTTMALIA